MSLQELYQEIIVDHGKSPRHIGTLADASHQQIGHNPLCGDRLALYVRERNGVIVDARFQGEGCAIAMASTSLMIEAVIGKTLEEVTNLFNKFHQLVTRGSQPEEDMGKLAAFAGVAEFPVRVKCATLAWQTLKAALANEPKTVSTEA